MGFTITFRRNSGLVWLLNATQIIVGTYEINVFVEIFINPNLLQQVVRFTQSIGMFVVKRCNVGSRGILTILHLFRFPN